MVLFRQPEPKTIHRFLENQEKLQFTYAAVGATTGHLPAGYAVDHTRVKLGNGRQVFEQACRALRNWQHLQLGWVTACPSRTSIRQGEVVVVVARSMGLWWLNACRIVYVIDESLEKKRVGFASGTLPAHAGSGEERFLVEMDDDGTVWYDILAFSRPQHLLARVGYPYLRFLQRQFGKQSANTMKRIISDSFEIEATSECPGSDGHSELLNSE